MIASQPTVNQSFTHSAGTLELAVEATTEGVAVTCTLVNGGQSRALEAIAPACARPSFAVPEHTLTSIRVVDVLEHVVDEEAWIRAAANALTPGGEVIVRVPLEGPIAWIDALNMYRYVQDITGFGKELNETKMKGWHRHYRADDIADLLVDAGLEVTSVTRSGTPHLDILHFGALIWGKLIRRKDGSELRAKARRDDAESGLRLPHLGPFSTKVTVRARKPF